VEMQPILIVDGEAAEVPNGADVLFCVEGAAPQEADFARFSRICILFPDADAALKQRARNLWKALKERDNLALTYWQQDARGHWLQRA